MKVIFFYNFQTDQGLNFTTGSIAYQGYSFNNGMIILAVSAVVWNLLGLYLDQVVPSQFGVAKPWYFCCRCRSGNDQAVDDLEAGARLLDRGDAEGKDPRNFEAVPESLKKQEMEKGCLKVRGLVKKFGEKAAVNGTNLTMYSGQIFALLGHNGAGKTTTISMLTGLLEPTAGQAEVFGIDIFRNMDEVRK